MKKSKVFVLLIIICMITIGFAVLSDNLSIIGLTSVKENRWNIYIDKLHVREGGNLEVESPSINNEKNEINYKINLNKPGDVYSFEFSVINDGTIDAMIDIYNNTPLTEAQSEVIKYQVTYSDGSEIEENNLLESQSFETYKVVVEFNKDITDDDLLTADLDVDFTISIDYVQADSKAKVRERENSYLVYDLSGNNNIALVHGAVKNESGTLTTDGVDDYIDCGYAKYNFGNQVTIATRIKINKKDSLDDFFGNWESGGLGLGISYNRFLFNIYLTSQYVTFETEQSVSTNTWYTLVGVYDGSNMYLYINGEKVLNKYGEDHREVSSNIKPSPMRFYIGANPESDGIYLPTNVEVSQALIYDRALSEEEIKSNYVDTINVTSNDGLLFYYDFK